MMKFYNNSYTRATRFCKTCRDRILAKFNRRKLNSRLAAKKASTSADNRTGSYSNYSNPGKLNALVTIDFPSVLREPSTNCVELFLALSSLSQSLSESGSQSPTGKRSRNDEGGPSRNVARRTGGQPLHRANDQNQSSESRSSSSMAYPDMPSTQSSEAANQSSPTRRHTRSHGPTIELDIDIDDGDHGATNQSGTGTPSSQSMQAAPLPRHRHQRTEPLTRPPTPERMRNMSAAERSQNFQSFNRGSGG